MIPGIIPDFRDTYLGHESPIEAGGIGFGDTSMR